MAKYAVTPDTYPIDGVVELEDVDAEGECVKKVRKSLKELELEYYSRECAVVAAAPELTEPEYEALRDKVQKTASEKKSLVATYMRLYYGMIGAVPSGDWVERWGSRATRAAYRNLRTLRAAGETAAEAVQALLREEGMARQRRRALLESAQSGSFDEVRAVEAELASLDRNPTLHANVHELLTLLGYAGLDDESTSLTSKQLGEAAKRNSARMTCMRDKSRSMFGVVLLDSDESTAAEDGDSVIRMANSILESVYGMTLRCTRVRAKKGLHNYRYSLGWATPFGNAHADGVVLPGWGVHSEHLLPDYECTDIYGSELW